jgi:hypothetical protein
MKRKNNNQKINIQPVTRSFFQQEMRKLGGRMTGFDKRMDGFDKRMDGFDKRMDGFDKRMDKLEKNIRIDLNAHKISTDLKIDDLKVWLETSLQKFYSKMYNLVDPVMKELVIMREENIITTGIKHQVNNHEERLETVEEKLGITAAL